MTSLPWWLVEHRGLLRIALTAYCALALLLVALATPWSSMLISPQEPPTVWVRVVCGLVGAAGTFGGVYLFCVAWWFWRTRTDHDLLWLSVLVLAAPIGVVLFYLIKVDPQLGRGGTS